MEFESVLPLNIGLNQVGEQINGNAINGGAPLVIAGPCSAETREQVMKTAVDLAERGVRIFRAGVWKPRTKPGGFEGIGAPALKWLRDVKRETGMRIAVEGATRAHVVEALKHDVDILWIGARTSGNPFAVQEIADALRGREDVTVLVKNPMNPDVELWIGALQRIYNAGIRRLGAIHRGFSVYGESYYRNNPEWGVPLELRVRHPELPIICDPSHIGGKRELVAPIAQQALDMGFDGLIVECHCSPESAWSDSEQQLTPPALDEMLRGLMVRGGALPEDSLRELRREIDRLDGELLDILARRMAVAREIGMYKRCNSIPVVQPERYGEVMESRVDKGVSLGLGREFLNTLLSCIHEESVRQQV